MRKPSFIILVMLVVTIGIGGIIGFAVTRYEQKDTRMTAFEIKNIASEMTSSSEGRKYNVNMDLYLELNSDIIRGLSPYLARKQLMRNLGCLDYDIVSSDVGMKYITEQIISWFVDDIERDRDVGNIYVSNIVTGPYKFYQKPEQMEQNASEISMDAATQRTFHSLFKAANLGVQ